MANLPDFQVEVYDVSQKMSTVCERGQFCVYGTTGSGATVGETAGFVKVESTNNGAVSGAKFAGVAMHPHVSLDTTKYDLNQYKHEHLVNYPTTLAKKGFIVSDNISGTPTVGATAYLALSGKVSPVDVGLAPVVGVFEDIKDELGFAKIRFTTV